jgi:hypothetical protein
MPQRTPGCSPAWTIAIFSVHGLRGLEHFSGRARGPVSVLHDSCTGVDRRSQGVGREFVHRPATGIGSGFVCSPFPGESCQKYLRGSPITGSPITESPITESPITESPITESPITESPITESPITESPITESPITLEATEWGAVTRSRRYCLGPRPRVSYGVAKFCREVGSATPRDKENRRLRGTAPTRGNDGRRRRRRQFPARTQRRTQTPRH